MSPPTRCVPREQTEQGSAVIELPLLVGLILIPFGLLILTFPVWAERQMAARDGAAEAARVLAYGGSIEDSETVLRSIEAGYGLDINTLSVAAVDRGGPGSALRVEVSVVIPGVVVPGFGPVGERVWSSAHVERAPDFGESG